MASTAVAKFFSFPNPVNDVAARTVAAGALTLSVLTIALDVKWLTIVLAYGFVARVLTGPTMSPLGQLATRVVAPRLPKHKKLVPGPPKRFAQGIGATLSVTAAILAVGFGLTTAAYVLVAFIIVAASLESILGFCLGCQVFRVLMKTGVIPEDICEECNNIWKRYGKSAPATGAAPLPKAETDIQLVP